MSDAGVVVSLASFILGAFMWFGGYTIYEIRRYGTRWGMLSPGPWAPTLALIPFALWIVMVVVRIEVAP